MANLDIFDKRDEILDLHITMLEGKESRDEEFISLVNFENWCSNGGLTGFIQDLKNESVKHVLDFSVEYKFQIVEKMSRLLLLYIDKYGLSLSDKINETEFDDLSKYDREFFSVVDEYTNAIYKKYIEQN